MMKVKPYTRRKYVCQNRRKGNKTYMKKVSQKSIETDRGFWYWGFLCYNFK